MKRTILIVLSLLLAFFAISACSTQADTVNKNLDKEAESFRVYREISFINGITDKEMVKITGFCSLEYGSEKIDVTCKEDGQFFRNTITRSDNSFVVSQQLDKSDVSDTHYKLLIRPGTLIPDIDVQ